MSQLKPIRRALLSVSDKTGIVGLARALSERGVALLSTGGTAAALQREHIAMTDVSAHTGFPEIMDGRVKTLQPAIHGGILGRRDVPAHMEAMRAHAIAPIDLVVVNLYPFEQTVARGAAYEEAIEQIDIGGPAMIRAAAKNHRDVVVIVDPADYSVLLEELEAQAGRTGFALRQRLAAKAMARTASYDSAIARWFAGQEHAENWPPYLLDATRREVLRYGENPHQAAAVYARTQPGAGVVGARQLQGKALSYNNLNDTDAAWKLAQAFDEPAVVIVKHANPCGVALGEEPVDAFLKALACDPQSAFGGILAVNRPVDAALVEAIGTLFLEVIIAPSVTAEAKDALAAKKNLRLLEAGRGAPPAGWQIKTIGGGYLVQEEDTALLDEAALRCVTTREPTPQEHRDLRFAFTLCKYVASNAIVLARNGAAIGIGAGQMSRVDAVRLACDKAAAAGLETPGAVLASDAFFPFDDNVHRAAEAGITALIQPGGSVRDEEVIAAANAHDMAMLMTGIRHFRH